MGSIPEGMAPQSEHLINLQLGWPSPRLFAATDILEGANQVLTSESETRSALIYGPHAGHPPLRASLAAWLSTVYSTQLEPDRICITNGASANLANVLMRFSDPLYTRRVFMVEPTYFLACPIFEDNGFGGKLKGVPEGIEGGLDLNFLRRELEREEKEATERARSRNVSDKPTLKVGKSYPKIYKYFIYIVPTFSNPSGKTMSVPMRQDLVRLAREYDALIVSDDVYDFLSWSSDPEAIGSNGCVPPRLADIDRDMEGYGNWGNTISNGSFSKIIGPGIRVGWADAAPALIHELGETGSSSSGGAPSHLTSTFVDKMLRTDKLQSHIQDTLIPTYQSRYYTLNSAVEDLLVPLGVKVESNTYKNGTISVAGGFFLYLRLPHGLPSAKKVAAFAFKQYKLRVAFGHMFVVAGDEASIQRSEATGGFADSIRLCWAWHENDEIREGITRLASAIICIKHMQKSGKELEDVTIGIR